MAQKRGIANALANKIFKMQRITHGGVPGNIVRSARMIKEGKGSANDLKVIRNYLGISQSGATQARQGLAEARQTFGKIAQGAVLMDVASRGGATGAIAGAQLINMVTGSLDKWARSGSLDAVIARSFRKPDGALALERGIRRHALGVQTSALNRIREIDRTGGSPVERAGLSRIFRDANKAMRNPIQAELDRLHRQRKAGISIDETYLAKLQDTARGEADRLRSIGDARYALGRKMRGIGVGASYLAAGVAATKFTVGMGEALGGVGNLEGVREAQQQANILAASGTNDYAAQRAAALQVEIEKTKGKTGFLPVGGDFVARFLNGQKAEFQGYHQTRADLNAAGMSGDIQKLRELGRDRVLTRDYGLLGGKKMAHLNEMLATMGLSSVELEQKISAEVSKTIAKVSQLKNAAEDAAGRRDFGTARKLLAEANKELPGTVTAWENPEAIYTRQVGDRAAQRAWSRTQMARAGPRTGD